MEKGIFISYSHRDTDAVERLVKTIESAVECKVWFDHKLKGGEEYFSVIADKILENEYFIFVVSPNSVISDWCIHELEFAMSEKRKIIAIWLEEFMPPPRVRLVISNTHYIRDYELKEDSLAMALAQTLNAGHLNIRGESEYVLSEQKLCSKKYFVSPDECSKIAALLEKEKKEDHLTCFEKDAAVLLGLAYELGIDVEKDTDRAAFYYHIAAHKGSLDGEYLELSLKLDTDKRATPEIIGRMNELAESGCMKALVYWGDEVYLGNWGMAPDKETAYRWFNKAARLGDPVAKYFVGYGYRVGESVGTDYALAWMYFLESAQQHFPRAFRQIAMMYKKGQFVEKDLDTARKYYKKAVDSGDGLSVNYLGDLEYNDKNYEKAFAYYLEAAEYVEKMGLPNGAPYYNLGWSYEFEQGVARDIETAVDYYFKAVKLKHKSSAARISSTIFKLSDTAQKRDLLEKASTLNCAEAEYYLAQTFESVENGKTVKSADALRYYEKGADKGCLDCIENCMYYYSWLYGGDNFANRRKSLENFRLFFSLIDLPENEKYRKKSADVLVSKYYCYAAELDIDEENKKPDKSLALYYYRKCLDDARGMNYFVRISGIAHQYAMEHTSNSIYYTDYAHSEEIAELCFEYIDRALEHAKKENTDVSETVKHLVDCYTMLYSTAKNKKARNKADFFDSRINAIKNKL